jgi:hypothetical protein
MQEIGCAIEWIDYPHKTFGHYVGAKLFAYHPGPWFRPQQDVRDQMFGRSIYFGHEISCPLEAPSFRSGRALDSPDVSGGLLRGGFC